MNALHQALMNGVELKHLRYALVAAELRSFGRAAAIAARSRPH
jgi:DNA-binding transcriptional LysR family regulator